ncbi:hypothetical protein ACIRBX_02595 [Kitasatospora sp. NPDC096147]|uniref:hypothetical protein n=1 Tax=Kitasatospora sp. NPDC096147 TaxID=3364093 RepID=UPI00382836AE
MPESDALPSAPAGPPRWAAYADAFFDYLTLIAGVLLADLLAPGFTLGSTGTLSSRIAAAGVIAGLMSYALGVFTRFVTTDRTGWTRTVPGVLVVFAGPMVLGAVTLWAGAEGQRLLGLPAAAPGFGTVVTAALLAMEAASLISLLTQLPFRLRTPIGPDGPQPLLLRRLLLVGGLALSAAVLSGVSQSGDGGWHQRLTFVLLAALLSVRLLPPQPRPMSAADFLRSRVVAAATATAWKLWAVTWLSGWTLYPLHVAGLRNYALTGLITALVVLPGTLYELHLRFAAGE